jgi:hypothetical protein
MQNDDTETKCTDCRRCFPRNQRRAGAAPGQRWPDPPLPLPRLCCCRRRDRLALNTPRLVVTNDSSIVSLILMRHRGEGWKRSVVAGIAAGLASAVWSVAGEAVIMAVVRNIGPAAAQLFPTLASFVLAFWIGVALLVVWLILRLMRLTRGTRVEIALRDEAS